jgi:hypothetical protein
MPKCIQKMIGSNVHAASTVPPKRSPICQGKSSGGKCADADNELLMRLYDRKRRIIDRVIRIEAALDVKS